MKKIKGFIIEKEEDIQEAVDIILKNNYCYYLIPPRKYYIDVSKTKIRMDLKKGIKYLLIEAKR